MSSALLALVSGCAPRLIKNYVVRKHDVLFVVQQGTSFEMGDCRRAPDGKLSDCRVREVEFD